MQTINVTSKTIKPSKKLGSGRKSILKEYMKSRYLFLLLLPAIIWYIIFQYIPMYGALIAFKDFKPMIGIMESPWVGFKHFERIISGTTDFARVLRNTIVISFLRILFGFPAPILFAILLNEVRNTFFKKITQTISYLPHFLSWVILAGIITQILSPSVGVVNKAIESFGGTPIYFLTKGNWFVFILIFSGVWQGIGWGSIIYIASITSVDPQLYEAAIIDGAGRLKQVIYITLPSITPVITIMLIFTVGGILNAGFDQIFNLYNPVVYDVADIIDTYVYRVGLVSFDYSFSTAVGLFKNLVGFALVILTNLIARRLGEYGIW